MKLINKKANAFVYTIIIINLTLIMALVVYNNIFVIKNNFNISENNAELTSSLKEKADIDIALVKQYNTNWWWFNDSISCPETLTFFKINSSWQIVSDWMTDSSLSYKNWISSCEFLYKWEKWYINIDNINFSYIDYHSRLINLVQTGSNLMTETMDNNQNYILFRKNSKLDNIDDDFNSDNFRAGSIDNIQYPDWYYDDDIFPRLTLVNNISASEEFYNVLWTNKKILKKVDENIFNSDPTTSLIKISEVDSWIIKLDISSTSELNYEIKIIEFDREIYENSWELSANEIFNSTTLNSNSWYISINSDWNVILNKTKTLEEYNFNFKEKDYWIFIKNHSDWELLVNLTWEEKATGKNIYLNAINDSFDNKFEVFVNHIIIWENWYIYGDYKKIESKDYFSNFYNCEKSWDIAEARSRYPWCDTKDIIMCDWKNSWIVVAACNVWAKYAGTYKDCVITSSVPYVDDKNCSSDYLWAHFQWWNNYPFKIEDSPLISDTKLSIDWYWNWKFYENNVFITSSDYPYSWSIKSNTDLWSWNNNRWPCANGYRLFSQAESVKMNELWSAWVGAGRPKAEFKDDFLFPLLGSRHFRNWNLDSIWKVWHYWTSDIYDSWQSYYILFDNWSFRWEKNNRSYARSVRCVKN